MGEGEGGGVQGVMNGMPLPIFFSFLHPAHMALVNAMLSVYPSTYLGDDDVRD